MTDRFAQVALPLALAEPYTYRVPPSLADRALPGARVVVPVRRRELVGVVTAVDVPPPAAVARDLLGAPDADVAVPPPLLALARQVAHYYGAPLGLTLRAMLPGPLWGHSQLEAELVPGGPTAVGGTAEAVLDWLVERGGRGDLAAAARAFKRPLWDVVDRLQRVGAIAVHVVPPDTSGNVATVRVVRLAGDPAAAAGAGAALRAGAGAAPGLRDAGTARRRIARRPSCCRRRTPAPACSRRSNAVDWWCNPTRRRSATLRRAAGDAGAGLVSGPAPRGGTARRDGTGRCDAPVRRHRFGQDAGVPRTSPSRTGRGAGRADPGARDRAHAADRQPGARRLRRPGGGAAQRTLRRRARRRLAGTSAR